MSATAAGSARPTSSDVPGWAGCALTTTGQPAARAEAVSPPATENASGKLLAPNTATGPSAIMAHAQVGARQRLAFRQRAGRCARRASCRRAARSANSRSWPTVRPRSPSRRARGRPVSAMARTISASPRAMIWAAMASRNAARCSERGGAVGVEGLRRGQRAGVGRSSACAGGAEVGLQLAPWRHRCRAVVGAGAAQGPGRRSAFRWRRPGTPRPSRQLMEESAGPAAQDVDQFLRAGNICTHGARCCDALPWRIAGFKMQ